MRYFVVRCTKCGHHRAIGTNNIQSFTFKCFRCGKNNKLKSSMFAGLNVKAIEVDNTSTASRIAIQENGKEGNSTINEYKRKK